MDWLTAFDQLLGQYSNIAKALGAIIVLLGLFLTYRRTVTLERGSKTDSDRMKAEVFTKATNQLGHEDIAVRLGGIYALERIARTSPEYHWPIMETLTAYVRHHSSQPEGVNGLEPDQDADYSFKRKVDIQAVITVLARRETAHETDNQRLDLTNCFLGGINLTTPGENNLANADFSYSKLWWSNLSKANLTGARFRLASLRHANLKEAQLPQTDFLKGDIYGANLAGANIRGATFNLTEIGMVEFEGAIIDKDAYLPLPDDSPQWDNMVRA